jgi:glycosyltransferase involved in cell wall biosynthesis
MPAISILTPTWNRGDYLRRVWTSLSAQTSTDFEWIVADDSSSDSTGEIVRAFAERSSFPILYLRAEAHVGKARLDNEAIRRARGEFILWCDSDDWLEPNAVERLLSVWQSIDEGDRAQFLGVTALAATKEDVIFNPFGALQQVDLTLNDLAQVKSTYTDMIHMVRTDVMRANPFPEVDLVVPESAVWSVVGHCPSRLISEVLLRKEYRAPHAVSFGGKMSYNRGRAHAAAISQREFAGYACDWRTNASRLINFLRYCRHGEVGLAQARALWSDNSKPLAFWAAVPLGSLLALADVLRNKVVRSHREFLANRDSPVIATWLRTEAGPCSLR